MSHAGEIVTFAEPGSPDDYGDYVAGETIATAACVVYPAGSSPADGVDFSSDSEKLIVLAPAGTPVQVGSDVVIRGQVYTVRTMAWDWAAGRRPVNSMHRPKVQIMVERAEATNSYE